MTTKNYLVFITFILTALSFPARSTLLIENIVPPKTIKTLSTVAKGKVFKLNSAVFTAQWNCGNLMIEQRVLKSGQPVTSYISVNSRESLQIIFNPAIIFKSGETIDVENGDPDCSSAFTLQGI